MDLPRIASQTSICPQNIQLLTDFRLRTPRTPFSQRLQAAYSARNNISGPQAPSKPPPPTITVTDNDNAVGNGGGGGVNTEPHFPQLSSSSYQPSRRLEEARTMENLRKRVQPELLMHPNQLQQQREKELRKKEAAQKDLQLIGDVIENGTVNGTAALGIVVTTAGTEVAATSPSEHQLQQQLDNRPYLLQKILSNRPVSIVLDQADLRTAWQDSDFISDCLCWHNVYRERHCSPLLTMSSELCHLAQTWANHLAHTNRFYYRRDRDIGQNLFCRPANSLQNDITGQEVSTYWYNAVRQYNYGKEPDMLHANVNAGSFTQVVWATSRHFGVGMATSRSGKVTVVAHYAPAGNITGHFQHNVLPPELEVPTIPPPPAFQGSNDSSGTDDSRSNTTTRS